MEAVADGTITISNPQGLMVNYQWSSGNSISTSSFNNTSKTFDVKAGDRLALMGNANVWGNTDPAQGFHISSTNDVYVYGNVMSLVKSSDFANLTTLTGQDVCRLSRTDTCARTAFNDTGTRLLSRYVRRLHGTDDGSRTARTDIGVRMLHRHVQSVYESELRQMSCHHSWGEQH